MARKITLSFDIPKGSRINRMIAKDFDAFRTGLAEGNADMANVILKQAQRKQLVEGGRSKSKAYRRPPGANVQNRSGKQIFVKGKFVSRSGRLSDALEPVKFRKVSPGYYVGKNTSPDATVYVNPKEIEFKYTGHAGLVLKVDNSKGRGRRKLFVKSLNAVRNTWMKIVKHGIDKKLKANRGRISG